MGGDGRGEGQAGLEGGGGRVEGGEGRGEGRPEISERKATYRVEEEEHSTWMPSVTAASGPAR